MIAARHHKHQVCTQWRVILLAALVALAVVACVPADQVPPSTPAALPPAVASPSARAPVSPVATQPLLPTPSVEPIWRPAPGTTWQWQLSELPVDATVDAAVYDIDLFDNDAAVVAKLHRQGRKVICYISAGTWEEWRSDVDSFPSGVLGRPVVGWKNERWLDIRQLDILAPIIERRMDACKAKGFDGIEPDNIDGFTNETGFPLTYTDQLAFNRFLAAAAHARSLAVALKNDLEQAGELVDQYDFAINEQCFVYNTCDLLTPFIQAGKAVFHVEYTLDTAEFCPRATALGFSSMKKRLKLDAYREPCRQP